MFASNTELRAFMASLRTAQIGKRIDHRQRAGSTNDLALQAAREGAPHGQVFVAEAQDAGRGRRGRKWECPAGLGLLFSVIVRPEALAPGVWPARTKAERTGAAAPGWIPLVTGLACAEAIGAVCGLTLAAKWPNDVVLPCAAAPGWRKLGGILCESAVWSRQSAGGSDCGYVVIGVGLNLNHSAADLPAEARTPPTSILLETGKPCARKEVFGAALERLEQHLLELYSPDRSQSLKKRLENQLRQWWPAQRTLTVQAPANGGPVDGTVQGHFLGLDEQGRLAMQDEQGRRVVFADAEVLSVH